MAWRASANDRARGMFLSFRESEERERENGGGNRARKIEKNVPRYAFRIIARLVFIELVNASSCFIRHAARSPPPAGRLLQFFYEFLAFVYLEIRDKLRPACGATLEHACFIIPRGERQKDYRRLIDPQSKCD